MRFIEVHFKCTRQDDTHYHISKVVFKDDLKWFIQNLMEVNDLKAVSYARNGLVTVTSEETVNITYLYHMTTMRAVRVMNLTVSIHKVDQTAKELLEKHGYSLVKYFHEGTNKQYPPKD